jgi:DNA-binding transcriptional LysR family regulator
MCISYVMARSLDSRSGMDYARTLDSLFENLNNESMKTEKREPLWADVHWLGVLGLLGSFTAAANRMGVSKATMSARIAELERAAGVALVQRTTRSVRLTEAGQRLADSTQDAFELIARSFAAVRELTEAPQGLLRVTAPVALGRQHVLPHLPGFLREHPHVRLELDLSDRIVALAREGFDLAIRHTTAPPETHVAWALCETRSFLVASKAYVRRRGLPQSPADLAEHDCLHYPRAGSKPAWSFERRRSGVRTSVIVAGPFSANNSEALREAALAGLGIAVLPDFSTQSALESGKLVEILTGWQPVGGFGDRIYALRPYSPHVPRAVQAFVSHMRHALAGGFGPRTSG